MIGPAGSIPVADSEWGRHREYKPLNTRCGSAWRGGILVDRAQLTGLLVPDMTATVLPRTPLAPSLLAELRRLLGDRLSTSAAVCAQHGKDESYHAPHSPDAVAFAQSTDEVPAIVSLCCA